MGLSSSMGILSVFFFEYRKIPNKYSFETRFSLKAFVNRFVFFLKHSLREKNCESVNPSTLEPRVEVCLSFKVVSQKIVVRSTGQPRLILAW